MGSVILRYKNMYESGISEFMLLSAQIQWDIGFLDLAFLLNSSSKMLDQV